VVRLIIRYDTRLPVDVAEGLARDGKGPGWRIVVGGGGVRGSAERGSECEIEYADDTGLMTAAP